MDEVPKFLQAKYDNVEFIDQGAHERVYKCTRAETVTAVKILDALDSESQKRFRSEVDILQRIDHKNVLKVLDAGDTDGYYWYESDFASEGHFGQMAGYLFYSDLDRVKYFSQICSGVQALHDLNPPIIHRDLKPSNILAFLDPEQRTVLKIADFGLAALAGNAPGLTASGAVLGTAHYIAPERMRNPRIKSPQSDIYSLGITFLEACTGRWLPSKENLELVPATFRHIVEKMVREHPDDRYQTVAEVLEAFNSLPFDRLFYGRELGENERGVATYHINIGRELENAINQLLKSSADNVLDRLAALERTLDRLVDAHDHEAAILVCIDRNIAALIEKAKPGALFRIVERFSNATRLTKDQDWHHPDLYSWSHFFAETFDTSSYFNTKSLCLEGLAYILDRFGGPEVKHCLYRTIKNIEDPNDMEELAKCLRQVGREDIARLLDGAPDQCDLDLDAITVTLRGTN
jgi:serine/threonine protein kinase